MDTLLNTTNWFEWITALGTSYVLIAAAEIGDKSQLICMALAARYRAIPVILGSVSAFACLNILAVVFGVAIANWLPELYISLAVAALFIVFGIQALGIEEDKDDGDEANTKNSHSIFFTTFLLITVAEFGDKTQLAVVALSSSSIPLAVWFGATLALATTSVLGVWAGRTILQKIPISLLHRVSGVLFILLGLLAAYNSYLIFVS